MATPPESNIDDKEGLIEAINTMKPGEFLEVQGNGGPMTIGVPSLKDVDVQPINPSQRPQEGDSWLD